MITRVINLRALADRLRSSRRHLSVAAMLVVMLSIATAAQACPACKQALASTENTAAGNPIQGFMWSILFMMSMPFLLLGGFGTYLWYIVRRARLAAEAQAAATAASQHSDTAASQYTATAALQSSEVAAEQHEPETVEVG
jgi:hypothetical protein